RQVELEDARVRRPVEAERTGIESGCEGPELATSRDARRREEFVVEPRTDRNSSNECRFERREVRVVVDRRQIGEQWRRGGDECGRVRILEEPIRAAALFGAHLCRAERGLADALQ